MGGGASGNSAVTAAKSSMAKAMEATKAGKTAVAAAQAFAASLNMKTAKKQEDAKKHFEAEVEINDYPQQARWKITHKQTLSQITDFTGAAITCKGTFVPPGRSAGPGER